MSDLVAGLRKYARIELTEAALKRLSGLPDATQDADAHDGRARFFTEAADALERAQSALADLEDKRFEDAYHQGYQMGLKHAASAALSNPLPKAQGEDE